MISANDVRKGMAIRYNNDVCLVLETQHRTPGNLRAFVQATIRSLRTGKSSDVRFGSTEKVEVVSVQRRKYEFSYKDQTGYTFMDPETYENVTLSEEIIGNAKDYFIENLPVSIIFTEDRPASVELPPSVKLKITETNPGVRGNSATNVTKPGTTETGLVVQIPLFIEAGETVQISTVDGSYMARA